MSSHLWSMRRWIVAMLIGEAVGFAAAMALGRGVVAAFGEPEAVLPLLALSAAVGAVEGACLGLAQWLVLRGLLPRLRLRSWTSATMAGGAAAWMLGMFVGTHGFAAPPPAWALPGLALASGVVLGGILGAGQALSLRPHVATVGPWLRASAFGWALGLLFAYAGVALTPGPGLGLRELLIHALSGSAMALAPAWLTGLALQHLAMRRR